MPPDGGLTYIDFIAYQGNPVGSVTGQENLANWWDGTICKEVSLPQVCSSEYRPISFSRSESVTDWSSKSAHQWRSI